MLVVESLAVEQTAGQVAESFVVVLVAGMGAIHQRSLVARRWGNWLPQMEHSVKALIAAVERMTEMRD